MSLAQSLREQVGKFQQEQQRQHQDADKQRQQHILDIKAKTLIEGDEFFDKCAAEAKRCADRGCFEVVVELMERWDNEGGKVELMHHQGAWERALVLLQQEGFTAKVKFDEREEADELAIFVRYSVSIFLKW